jgi:hypothetical protein
MIVSSGEEMHILFLISRPVLKDGKPVMQTDEQALITIPIGYGKVLGNAILENYNKHLEKEAKEAKKNASVE